MVIAIMAVLSILGGGHAILDAFGDEPPAIVGEPAEIVTGRSQLVSAFAQQFIVTYLSSIAGQQDLLSQYVSSGQQTELPSTALQIKETMVVFSARAVATPDLDVWSVTISVRLARPGATATDTRLFYRVGVSAIQGRLRALTLPSVVSPPEAGFDLELAYSSPCATSTPFGAIATGFLTAFLAGSGDVNRYTSVDSGIAALQPPPFTGLDVVSVSADDSTCGDNSGAARILVTIRPKSAGGTVVSLAYPLTLRRTAGQWQVISMDSIPALADPLAIVNGQPTGPQPMATTTPPSPSSAGRVPPARQN